MGANYFSKCNSCDDTAEISGGKDRGFFAIVQTMTCQECKELADVLIGYHEEEGETKFEDDNKMMGLCPICEGSNVAQWDKRQSSKVAKSPEIHNSSKVWLNFNKPADIVICYPFNIPSKYV